MPLAASGVRNRPVRLSRVLAISSGGGHWVQLLRLLSAFEGCSITYATVSDAYVVDVPSGSRFAVVPDATRWDRWRFACMIVAVAWLVFRLRPAVIITTGAAPGYAAIRIGRLLGARTIWLDSIANVEEISMSGQQAGRYADLWLTQWPHLARPEGPHYRGQVL